MIDFSLSHWFPKSCGMRYWRLSVWCLCRSLHLWLRDKGVHLKSTSMEWTLKKKLLVVPFSVALFSKSVARGQVRPKYLAALSKRRVPKPEAVNSPSRNIKPSVAREQICKVCAFHFRSELERNRWPQYRFPTGHFRFSGLTALCPHTQNSRLNKTLRISVSEAWVG